MWVMNFEPGAGIRRPMSQTQMRHVMHKIIQSILILSLFLSLPLTAQSKRPDSGSEIITKKSSVNSGKAGDDGKTTQSKTSIKPPKSDKKEPGKTEPNKNEPSNTEVVTPSTGEKTKDQLICDKDDCVEIEFDDEKIKEQLYNLMGKNAGKILINFAVIS